MSCLSASSTMSIKVVSVLLAVLLAGVLLVRYGRGFHLSAPAPSAGLVQSSGLGRVGPVVRLDPFVVSEMQDDGEHVSTVTFEVEVNDVQARDAMTSRAPEIRSAILTVLADTQLSDIGDSQDLALLKKKVQDRIRPLLPGHAVRRVLITQILSL